MPIIKNHIEIIKENKWGSSKNRGIPKWMVKIMENPIEMDDLGVPLFLETPKWGSSILDISQGHKYWKFNELALLSMPDNMLCVTALQRGVQILGKNLSKL